MCLIVPIEGQERDLPAVSYVVVVSALLHSRDGKRSLKSYCEQHHSLRCLQCFSTNAMWWRCDDVILL